MAGIPLAGRYADPYGFSQNPYADPHALAGFLTRYTATTTMTKTAAGGEGMYYNNGFLGAGSNQTSLGGTILSGVLGGLESIFHIPAPGSLSPISARTPPMLPGGTGGEVTQHPVLTGAGSASGKTAVTVGVGTAVAGGLAGVLAPSLVGLGGHRARYAPPGTRGYHMIKKGPHAGMWTRNRHRNVANIRALRRALSRAHGFERICRKVVHFVSPHKRGRAVFKRRRRSR